MLAYHWHARLLALHPVCHAAINVIHEVFREHGRDCIVTSCTEGTHRRASLHYMGMAFDIRTKRAGIDSGLAATIAVECSDRLAYNLPAGHVESDWDVVVEPTHLHFEFQPKRPYALEPWTFTDVT